VNLPVSDLPAYRAELPFTYAFGRFAVLEALARRPADVMAVLWHGDMQGRQAAALLAAAEAAGAAAERDDATVARLRRKGNVYCLAQVRKREEALDAGADHVVLVRPSHPGNVGTAIRSLVAFGFLDLALIEPGIDPWGAYVVRASVGLRFALRCRSFGSLDEYVAACELRGAGMGPPQASEAGTAGSRRLYLFDAAGEQELDDVSFARPFSLVFGPEWSEVSPAEAAGRARGRHGHFSTVRIPQGNQVESLNLATAVSLAAYRARRLPIGGSRR